MGGGGGFEFLSIVATVLSSIVTSNRKSVFFLQQFPESLALVSNFWLCYDLVSVSVSVVYAQHLAYPHLAVRVFFLKDTGLSFFLCRVVCPAFLFDPQVLFMTWMLLFVVAVLELLFCLPLLRSAWFYLLRLLFISRVIEKILLFSPSTSRTRESSASQRTT